MEIPFSDSMLAAKALNMNIIKNRTDNCKKKIIKNFLLFKVSFNSHFVIVVNFKIITMILFFLFEGVYKNILKCGFFSVNREYVIFKGVHDVFYFFFGF